MFFQKTSLQDEINFTILVFGLCLDSNYIATRPQKILYLRKYKLGLQLFSVRDAMAEDPKGTHHLKRNGLRGL